MGTMVPDPIAPIGTSSDIIFNRRISPSNSFSDPFQIKEWRYSPEQHHRGLCEDNSS